jgi:hypothetical protein
MIEVAIVSLQRALIADGNEIPAGSADFAARPLAPDPDGLADAGAPAAATGSSGGTAKVNAGGVDS